MPSLHEIEEELRGWQAARAAPGAAEPHETPAFLEGWRLYRRTHP